jgi:hypothetical protein
MDELKVLQTFRDNLPPAEERTRAHSIAVLRAAIEAEKASATGRPRRPSRSIALRGRRFRVLLPGLFVAIVVAVLAVAWPFGGGSSVLAQAAAAIGNRPVTHVVIEYGLGGSLVDLRSGKRTPVYSRSETWYDPQRGLLALVSFRGQPVTTVLIRTGAKQPPIDTSQTFLASYKARLRAGAFHVTGSGTIDGTPVYWIASKPSWQVSWPFSTGAVQKQVEQIAISKTTYKPIYMRTQIDGHIQPASGVRIIKAETIAPQPSLFAHAHASTASLGAGYNGWSPQTTLAQAQAAMGRPPVVPATLIAGLKRTWIGQPSYLSAFNSYKDQLVGVDLYYGRLDPNNYGPPYQAPFFSITEFPRANVFVTEQGLSYFPDNNQAILEDNTATLKVGGLYIIITASDPTHALTAAKAVINR